MDLDLTPEQELMRRTVRDLMAREAPREKVREWDAEGIFPADLLDSMARIGLFGIPFPQEYGGAGLDAVDFTLVTEEMSRVDFDLAGAYLLTVFNAMNLLHHGSKAQKDYYLPRVVRGEQRFSISMTEPDAGSDVASLKATAKPDGDDFVINGQKMFCTAGGQPKNTIMLCARTDPNVPKHRGLTLFLVDANAPGLEKRRLPLLGLRIIGAYALFLDDVRVPREGVIGEVNGGWKVLLSGLDVERMSMGAQCLGAAQTAVDDATQYAKDRQQFGQPIGKFQAIAHLLADMQTQVEAARLLTYRAALLLAKDRPAAREAAMAKLFASETFVRVTNDGMQILGGYGYLTEGDMQRHFRNARISTIAGGTSQVQREIISRQAGL